MFVVHAKHTGGSLTEDQFAMLLRRCCIHPSVKACTTVLKAILQILSPQLGLDRSNDPSGTLTISPRLLSPSYEEEEAQSHHPPPPATVPTTPAVGTTPGSRAVSPLPPQSPKPAQDHTGDTPWDSEMSRLRARVAVLEGQLSESRDTLTQTIRSHEDEVTQLREWCERTCAALLKDGPPEGATVLVGPSGVQVPVSDTEFAFHDMCDAPIEALMKTWCHNILLGNHPSLAQ
eukprot:TRINITY_DN23877_c0_g1_i1.p1 TRINITY_DN23877_c0_g1~~TRINITY_DN23877_c0_g1_i1.p1  ORF type:complete len:232 (-),score=45.02 TRINITY_DN23877_c0_g1_i1:429-1124(-)